MRWKRLPPTWSEEGDLAHLGVGRIVQPLLVTAVTTRCTAADLVAARVAPRCGRAVDRKRRVVVGRDRRRARPVGLVTRESDRLPHIALHTLQYIALHDGGGGDDKNADEGGDENSDDGNGGGGDDDNENDDDDDAKTDNVRYRDIDFACGSSPSASRATSPRIA